MKLHVLQNGNGDKNGELFGNEMNSAYEVSFKSSATDFWNV